MTISKNMNSMLRMENDILGERLKVVIYDTTKVINEKGISGKCLK